MITNKTFCLKDILKGGLPCHNPKITWIIPNSDCLTSPCESCKDECIDITLLDNCNTNCIHVRIECEDCSSCPPETHKICFCNTDGDCEVCETCSDAGVCVEKCEHCDPITGECGECSDNTDCPGDLECIQGKCQCPPGTTQDGTICRECSEDGECGPCKVCTENGKCVPKDCGSGVCDPETGECVGCINSGQCGPNEVCVDGECECAPGYVYDPIEGCIPAPPCETDGDCGPCMKCTEDGCVPRECPDGYVCYDDDCVKLCNCDEPSCDKANHGCQRISSDLCACLPCEDGGDCNEIPCEDGTDCPDGYGCQGGVCVPCYSLDCSTGECDDVLGCECLGTRCVDSDNKCNGTCSGPEDCGEGCGCYHGKCVSCDNFDCEDCADVPGCACNESTGRCEDDGLECSDTFEINKRDDNCAIEGILVTDKGCQCDRLSMGVKVQSVSPGTQLTRGINFLVELRKGDADEEGILNIPLLSQTGIANELPLPGNLQVRVVEKKRSSSYTTPVAEDVVFSQIFSLAGIDTLETGVLDFNPPGSTKQDPVTGDTVTVGEVEVEFILKRKTLNFENRCSYSEEDSVVRYRITADGGNGFIKYSQISGGTSTFRKHEVLESASNRNPIFSWYKSTTQGNETKFRSAYATKESPGYFRDGWISVAEGVEIGKFYRLESDCACDESVFYTCPNSGAISKLRYCNPNDLTQRLVYTLSDCNKTINLKAESNTFNVCASNSIGGQVYELYLNGQKVDKDFTASNGQIVFSGSHTISTSITEIAIKLKDHACDDCYEPVELTPAELTVESVEYDCDSKTLDYSVSGGTGNYSLTIDDIPYPLFGEISLTKGEHIVKFTDNETGCTSEQAILVDCCSLYTVSVDNIEVCSDATTLPITFVIDGGEGPYDYTVTNGEQGTVVAEGTTQDTTHTINPQYDGVTGTYTIKVVDARGCGEDILTQFQVSEATAPTISIVDNKYCDDAVTHEFTFNVTGGSSFVYSILDDGSPIIGPKTTTGTFSESLDVSGTHQYSVIVEVEDSASCDNVLVLDNLQPVTCPPPTVDVTSNDVCKDAPLVITAVITGGTPYAEGYDWEVKVGGDTKGIGRGSNINLNLGTIYTASTGQLNISVIAYDSLSSTPGTDNVTIEVLPTGSDDCCCNYTLNPIPQPLLQIQRMPHIPANNTTNQADVGEFVELSVGGVSDVNYGDGEYVWDLIDSNVTSPQNGVGNNKALYPNTGTPGYYTFVARYYYNSSDPDSCCVGTTQPYTLIIDDIQSLPQPDPETPPSCDCDVTIKVNSGAPDLNGKIITSNNSTGNDPICYGDGPISFSAITSGCGSGATIRWDAWRYPGTDYNNRVQTEVGTGDNFSYTPGPVTTQNTTIYVVASVSDGTCSGTSVPVYIPIQVCASPDPFTVTLNNTPSEICETQEASFPVNFRVNAGAKPSGGYDTFSFSWQIGKLVGSNFTLIKAGTVGDSSWGTSYKDVSQTVNISSHVSPSSPMTLQVRIQRSGHPVGTVSKQITSLAATSGSCATCPDMNLTASVQQAPNGTYELEKGSQLLLTGEGTVDSPFTANISKYTWTWPGGSFVGKTLSGQYPTQNTIYTLTIEQNISGGDKCTDSTSVNVTVKESCKPTTQSLNWDVEAACPGDNVTLTWAVGTHSEYNVFVNGADVTNTSGSFSTVMPQSGSLSAQLVSKYAPSCDTTITNKTLVQDSVANCACVPVGIVISGPNTIIDQEDGEYSVVTNFGSLSGYTYQWFVGVNPVGVGGTSSTFTYSPASLNGSTFRQDSVSVEVYHPTDSDCDAQASTSVIVQPACSYGKYTYGFANYPGNCSNTYVTDNITITASGSYPGWTDNDILAKSCINVFKCEPFNASAIKLWVDIYFGCVPTDLFPITVTGDVLENGVFWNDFSRTLQVGTANTKPCANCGEVCT